MIRAIGRIILSPQEYETLLQSKASLDAALAQVSLQTSTLVHAQAQITALTSQLETMVDLVKTQLRGGPVAQSELDPALIGNLHATTRASTAQRQNQIVKEMEDWVKGTK